MCLTLFSWVHHDWPFAQKKVKCLPFLGPGGIALDFVFLQFLIKNNQKTNFHTKWPEMRAIFYSSFTFLRSHGTKKSIIIGNDIAILSPSHTVISNLLSALELHEDDDQDSSVGGLLR